VSRLLTAIEEAVGAALVVRGRDLALTSEGALLHAAAERVESLLADAAVALRAAKEDVSGTVRLSCPPGLLKHVLLALKPARQKYPSLTCEVNGDTRTVDLAKGEADLAVRAFRPSVPDLIARRLGDFSWGVFASRAYQASHGLPDTVDELPRHALVLYPASMHSVPAMRWMDDHRGSATELVRADNVELAAHVIGSGGGLGVLPGFVAANHADLVRVFNDRLYSSTLYCVYHETSRDTARVRAVSDALAAYFEANAAAFLDGDFSLRST
jgi:DNA-binding transcriptional LysR family regulator